ncbi:CPBP family intramembrane glutamic endopeptidase [Alkalicoccus chagannorensis]|uniref:CPBP family intramembrane glutamic endopeptidase n=1 Tax=Alkalicoccus chagannorensis TaxID=427072 RepID=UPI000415137C|nr:CPBP family intramembrane glutamic endopeptidase [Alkalicoccus chagannorensis]
MKNKQAELLQQMTDQEVYANVWFTQLLIAAAAFTGGWIVFSHPLYPLQLIELEWSAAAAGTVFAAVIVLLQWLLYAVLPSSWLDDGGINERIFSRMPVWMIAVLTFFIAVAEEWLFRGVLQETFGIIAASLLFAGIHIRYLSKPVLLFFVTAMSFGFGLVYMWSGNLLTVITAHFLVDFILALVIRFRSDQNGAVGTGVEEENLL